MIDHDASAAFLRAVNAAMGEARAAKKEAEPPAAGNQYAHEAVEEGRFAKDIIANGFRRVMGDAMAGAFADAHVARLFHEYAADGPGERLLVENLAVLHGQLLLIRARWAITTDLAEIESLTRIQSRLAAEMTKLMAAIGEQRGGARPLFQQVNLASTQHVVNQAVLKNELGGTSGR